MPRLAARVTPCIDGAARPELGTLVIKWLIVERIDCPARFDYFTVRQRAVQSLGEAEVQAIGHEIRQHLRGRIGQQLGVLRDGPQARQLHMPGGDRRKMAAQTMHSSSLRSNTRRSVAWLLWLALLLPLAQSLAAWHGLSHVHAQAADDRRDAQAPQASHCDLCLGAAALSGGALVARQADLHAPARRDARPRDAVASVWRGLAPLGYRSRAPPIASH